MASTARCSKCGAPVSDEVAGGFCTACLLEEGLAPADLKEAPITLKYFGDYELIEEIARGGMGVVFKARQRGLKRIVAVKMILSGHLASEAEAQRFRAEARAAAALQHPGIVAIHEVGEHEGLLFFSMDYIEGKNLAEVTREGPLSATRAAECLRDIAEAIHYAHGHGVLHRDLKPSNVLIDANGKPHVTDFGLAKQLNDSQVSTSNVQLTVSGQLLGSPNFMPPEQAAGKHRELTPASDVYSLGALLYHLLTGRPPFLADSIPATLRLVSETEPVAPRLLAPAVPRDLETICLKCLEKDPARRYGTARELTDELQRFLNHEPIRARPITPPGKLWRWSKRNPTVALLLAGLNLVGIAGVTGIAWQWRRAEHEATQARNSAARAETKSKEARQQQRIASEQKLLAQRRFYAAQMNLAYQAWESGNVPRTIELLETQRPEGGEEDLRGFDWFHLWGLCNERNLFSFHAHEGEVNSVAFSPDGKTLASGGEETVLRLWNVATGHIQKTLAFASSHPRVSAVAFTPDGETLVAASWDMHVRLWDLTRGQVRATLPLQPAFARSVAVSPDGKTLATGDDGGNVKLWDLQTAKLVSTLKAHHGPVMAVRFSPDGERLATGSAWNEPKGGLLALWELDPEPRVLWQVPEASVTISFAPDGRRLAVATWDTVAVLDASDGTRKRTFEGHLPRVNSVTFLPDGEHLLSGAADRTLRIWSTAKQTNEAAGQVFGAHSTPVLCVTTSADGACLASSALDGSVKIWSATNPSPPLAARFRCGPEAGTWTDLRTVLLSPDDDVLYTVTGHGTEVWNLRSMRKVASWPDAVGFGALSSDGHRLATANKSGIVALWETSTGTSLASVQAHANVSEQVSAQGLSAISFSPDGRVLATGKWELDQRVRFWDASDSLRPIRTVVLPGVGVSCFAFSPDQKTLAVVIRGTLAIFVDVATGKTNGSMKVTHGTGEIAAAAFSPDGKLLAISGQEDAVLWDAATRQPRVILRGHTGTVNGLCFSPDGKIVATGANDLSLRLWDVLTGQERVTFKLNRPVDCVRFSRDGKALVASSRSGLVWIWRTADRELP